MKEQSVETASIIGAVNGALAMASTQDLQEKYYDITELYDLSQELLDTVESEFVKQPKEQFALIEPLAEEVGDAADILTEEFIAFAEGKKKMRNKNRIEGALRKVY